MGLFIVFLYFVSVPKVSKLPQTFKDDVQRMLDQGRPQSKAVRKMADSAMCQLKHGFFFAFTISFRDCVWELYKLDCKKLETVLANHRHSSGISGLFLLFSRFQLLR